MLYDDNAVGGLPFQTAVYRTEKATVFFHRQVLEAWNADN